MTHKNTILVSDAEVAEWMMRFPVLQTDQIRDALLSTVFREQRMKKLTQLAAQEERRIFEETLADEKVAAQEAVAARSRPDGVRTEREYEQEKLLGAASKATRAALRRREEATARSSGQENDDDDDDDDDYDDDSSPQGAAKSSAPRRSPATVSAAELAEATAEIAGSDAPTSLWSSSSPRQRMRILSHYVGMFPLLTQAGIEQILAETCDLAAAELRMRRHAERRTGGIAAVPEPLRTCMNKKDRAWKEADERYKQWSRDYDARNKPFHPGTTAAPAALAMMVPTQQPRDDAGVHTSDEETIAFFVTCFPQLSLGTVIAVLRNTTDTDSRLAALAAAQQALESAGAPAAPPTKAAVSAAAQQLERQRATIDHYFIDEGYGAVLTREEIARIISGSTDTDAAIRRAAAQKEKEFLSSKQPDEKAPPKADQQQQQQQAQQEACATAGTAAPECLVCMSAPRCFAAIPCGHMVACGECAERLQKSGKTACCVCSRPAVGIFRIYL